MILYHIFLFIVLWSLLWGPIEMRLGKRNKRILYGLPGEAKQRDAYPVFRYYVSLAKGDIVENPSWWRKLTHGLAPSVDELVCGGSLLTPSIVQTACHCLARINRQSRRDNFTYAWPLNVWEDRIYAFVGSNDVSKMDDMLSPKHYVVYQQCRKLLFDFHYNLMDFGLIVSKDSIDKKAPKAALSYAPAYKGESIKAFYYQSIQNEYMCLTMGHGLWDAVRIGFVPIVIGKASQLVRWGWRTVMNYVDCLSATYTPEDRRREPPFNYTRHASWVCLKAFREIRKWNYNFQNGDSGGPVTCNDVYYGIVCMSSDVGAENIISFASPIAYTSYENSAEYRSDFIIWCEELDGLDHDIPYIHVTDESFIPTPPPDIHRASQSSLVTIHHHLFILPPTLIFSFYRRNLLYP